MLDDLEAILAGVLEEAWATASAPIANREFQKGYEDGKLETCHCIAYHIARVLGTAPKLDRPTRMVPLTSGEKAARMSEIDKPTSAV